MSGVKLGLCCSRPESFSQCPAQSWLENAVQFFEVSQGEEALDGRPLRETLSLAQLDASTADLERSLAEAAEHEVTHVLFLSTRTLLPFYSLERLLALGAHAASGISWTWLLGQPGEPPEVFPRIGYFDPEGRPYPYFGWSAPDFFEVDWCGLDCLLLSREALEAIAEPLRRIQGREPPLRISHCLRTRGIPILVDSSVQCPRAVTLALLPPEDGLRRMVPSRGAWWEFSRDNPRRRIPNGPLRDPAYRGRSWYREWVAEIAGGGLH